jgi:hypothetical protein
MNETEKMGWYDEQFRLSSLAHAALRTLRDSIAEVHGDECTEMEVLDRAADAIIEVNGILCARRSWTKEAVKARARMKAAEEGAQAPGNPPPDGTE